MKAIGLFEAKTNLSKIAEAVRRTGQPVTLTRRGEPYVDLVPHVPRAPGRRSNREVFEDLERLCRTLPKSSVAQIKRDVEQGRH
jgi:prevent-host-death family protein